MSEYEGGIFGDYEIHIFGAVVWEAEATPDEAQRELAFFKTQNSAATLFGWRDGAWGEIGLRGRS